MFGERIISHLMKSDHAISETVSVILIIFMVLILAIVVAGLLFGANIFQQKSALIVSDIKSQTFNSKNVISVFHRAGDEVYINSSLTGLQEMGIYVDNRSYSWRAQPVLGLNTVKPGTTLFIYYNASKNIYRITSNAATLSTNEAQSVVDCPLKVRLVDERARLLITSWNWTCTPPPLTGPAPTITGRTPTSGNRGWPITVSITGSNFLSGATAKLNRTDGIPTEIRATSCTVVNATMMSCTFNLPVSLSAPLSQIYNVVVTNPDGKQGMRTNYFTVYSRVPTLTSSTPSSGLQGATVTITNLRGNYFQPDATVVYWQGTSAIPQTGFMVINATSITGILAIGGTAPVGYYNISVYNIDNRNVTRANAFRVLSNAPTLSTRTPASGNRGWYQEITLTGSLFQSGASVTLTRGLDSIPITNVNVISTTQITSTLNLLGAYVPAGTTNTGTSTWNVTVINPDNKTITRTNWFTIRSYRPTIGSPLVPNTGVRGTNVSTSIPGSYFQPGATAYLYKTGQPNINATNVNAVSPTQITCDFLLPAGASTGLWNIRITNDDGRYNTRSNVFTVSV